MVRFLASVAALSLLGISSSGCSGDERAPGIRSQGSGGRQATGGRANGGGASGGTASGGASSDAGPSGGAGGGTSSGGASGSGGAPEAGGPECDDAAAPPAPASGSGICAADSTWRAGAAVPGVSTEVDDRFGSITFDELTIAWVALDGDVATVRYADRSSVTEPFFPSGALTPGYYGGERPALSADGLRIVVVREDGKAFGEFTRAGRFSTFEAAPSEAHFTTLNNLGVTLPVEERFGDPVLSEDDQVLYFSRYGGATDRTVVQSTRGGPVAWPVGAPLPGGPLRASCDQRRRPTGISADQLTLFYWDEVSGSQRATWRASLDAPFEGVVELGGRSGAQPNAACTALYHSGPGAGGGDLLVSLSE